ncbi:MAG: prepilin peptidase [bacterium]|nr:prepilin peptidase [bacterium]
MSYFLYLVLFILGLAVGSFINVISLRYQPGNRLLDKKIIGGRSRCPICHKNLVWYELIPVLNFFWQKGKCRHCGHRLSLQYPLVEILSGLIFVSIPWYLINFYQVIQLILRGEQMIWYYWLTLIWVLIFLLFLLLSIIDLRHSIIPNSINSSLAILGLILIIFNGYYDKFDALKGSFLGYYSAIFGLRENIWLNHLFAALLGMVIFGLIIFLSRGRAMGLGDLKLVGALGLIFGWPDILMVLLLAFIIGALVSIVFMIAKKKKMKDMIPFGPFLVIGSSLTFLFGYQIIDWYFKIFGL